MTNAGSRPANNLRSLLGLLGGAAIIVGVFLPGWSAEPSLRLTILQTAGLYAVALLAVALMTVVVSFMKEHWLFWATGIVSLALTVAPYYSQQPRMLRATAAHGGIVDVVGGAWSPASGWAVLLLGVLLTLVAAVLDTQERRRALRATGTAGG